MKKIIFTSGVLFFLLHTLCGFSVTQFLSLETQDTLTGFGKSFVLKNVKFTANGVQLPASDLDKIVAKMKKEKNKELKVVCFQSKDENASLEQSKRRANAIRKYIAKKGIYAYRIHAFGKVAQEDIAGTRVEVSFRKEFTNPDYQRPMQIENVKFSNVSDTLFAMSYPKLQRIVQVMKAKPSLEAKIIGHCVTEAGADYNMSLSEKRAIAVINYLVSQGVSQKRLTYKGYGDTKPISLEPAESSQSRNNRIEIAFKKQKP